MSEVKSKLSHVRALMHQHKLAAIRLKGVDWFSWATGGASNVVILTAERGIAEVLITENESWILTDTIEASRLVDEEAIGDFQIHASPWHLLSDRHNFISQKVNGVIASDRPEGAEVSLSKDFLALKLRLLPEEIKRYKELAHDAALAMTDVLSRATPDWTEWKLAGEGAKALWERGIHPTLTLVAGERRLPIYRHPTATQETLAGRAMLVFCARKYGLYANLTRFVYFRKPTKAEIAAHDAVALVESAAFQATQPEKKLSDVYNALASAYSHIGYQNALSEHHQGGVTGYLSREIVATPMTGEHITPEMAFAWNPSVSGAKIEDTVLCTREGVSVLTVDPNWPTKNVDGKPRPEVLVR